MVVIERKKLIVINIWITGLSWAVICYCMGVFWPAGVSGLVERVLQDREKPASCHGVKFIDDRGKCLILTGGFNDSIMNNKKRTRVIAAALILLGTIVGVGLLVGHDIIRDMRYSNVRFDETSVGQLYSRVPLDYNNPLNDLLVVTSSSTGNIVSVRCYQVIQGFDMVWLLNDVGIDYTTFTHSVYGIVDKIDSGVGNGTPPTYRFIFKENTTSAETWFMSRGMIPSYDYVNEANVKVHMVNEGISVDDVLDKINDILNIPF